MIQQAYRKSARLAAVLFVGLIGLGAAAAPQYASLSHDKAFLREGPSYQYRVLWIYRRKELPVQIIQTYDVWRKIRDSDGTTGWVHSSMLTNRRTVVVTSHRAARITDRPDGKVLALAQPGVVARLEACKVDACEISASGSEGWIEKKDIWGVGAGEVFQ